MEDFGNIVCSAFIVWFTLVVGLIVLPAMFGISLGITEVYMKVLVKTLEVLSLKQHITCFFWVSLKNKRKVHGFFYYYFSGPL